MRLFLLLLMTQLSAYTVQELSSSPKILLIENFLSDSECDHLIRLARPYLQPSSVVGEKGNKFDSRRSSEGMFLPQPSTDKKVKKIEKRIEELTHYPQKNGEAIHILHYTVGAEYQPHYDTFESNTPGSLACLNRGGQRVISFIMYLNTPTAGGETIFPKLSLSVTPKKGSALLFYNCSPSGVVDRKTLHGGAPVQAGEKWIATKWIRLGEFH